MHVVDRAMLLLQDRPTVDGNAFQMRAQVLESLRRHWAKMQLRTGSADAAVPRRGWWTSDTPQALARLCGSALPSVMV